MDIGLFGVLMVWQDYLWQMFWPLILVPIYVLIEKKRITNKLIFVIGSIIICYSVHFVSEVIFSLVVQKWLEKKMVAYIHTNILSVAAFMLFLRLLSSIILMIYMKKLKLFKLS